MVAAARAPKAPPAKAFSPLAKAALAGEILEAYGRVRWWLWRCDLPEAVAAARAAGTAETCAGERGEEYFTGLKLGRAVTRTLRVLPTDSRCLVRSLVLTRLLARRGIDSSLVLGVSVEPEFAAHAWVESEGLTLPADAETFRQLARL